MVVHISLWCVIKKKEVFSTESREENLKIKTNRYYYVYEGIWPFVNTSLFTPKFELCSNSLRINPESQGPFH